MGLSRKAVSLLLFGAIAALPATEVAAQKKVPYWASIIPGQAKMRTGPGRQFPATWLYQRAGLPVKVIETYPNWRKVEDPDGTQGWMQANLLSDDRTGLIRGTAIQPLREAPEAGARIIWRAEPGVVGKISECRRGWCKIDVSGKMGYVDANALFGVDPAELKP